MNELGGEAIETSKPNENIWVNTKENHNTNQKNLMQRLVMPIASYAIQVPPQTEETQTGWEELEKKTVLKTLA